MINHRKRDICGKIYDTSPFRNMMGNGENFYSRIMIYGNTYDCCPKCTNEVYDFLLQSTIKKLNKSNQ